MASVILTFPLRKSKAGDSTVAEIRAARYIGPERVSSDIILNVLLMRVVCCFLRLSSPIHHEDLLVTLCLW